ncbi:MAG TPA: glutaminyl-peptide cyclotransferase [Promineifilum sp.]|nr:glutaminyl-peptide cyclotransferase [Promineifilum sp.]
MKTITHRLLIPLFTLALLLAACDSPLQVTATLVPTAAIVKDAAQSFPAPGATSDGATTGTQPAIAAPNEPDVAATEVAYAAIVASQPTAMPTEAELPTPAPPITYTYRIVNTYPHDPAAFTQGLVFLDGALYEGTGRWGESTLRETVLETGEVTRSKPLEVQYLGEGITILNDRIYQLTWQEQTGFVYDRATFELLQTFAYPTEGWGITHDGRRLIVSDGTSTLYFRDPDTLQETGHITVRDHRGPVNRLNELEYVNGEIWANIWLSDLIARISPETGNVLGYIDLTGLLNTENLAQPADVLNGIAFDPATGRIFVTGKLWPSIFEIEVTPTS